MSRPMADTPKRRARRQFTDEFKASAVRLVLDEGKTVGAAARDLRLSGGDAKRLRREALSLVRELLELGAARFA